MSLSQTVHRPGAAEEDGRLRATGRGSFTQAPGIFRNGDWGQVKTLPSGRHEGTTFYVFGGRTPVGNEDRACGVDKGLEKRLLRPDRPRGAPRTPRINSESSTTCPTGAGAGSLAGGESLSQEVRGVIGDAR